MPLWREARSVARAVRLLELREDGSPRHPGLLVVDVGTRLVFWMAPSPKVDFRTLVLWTNAPVRAGEPFRRHTYSCLEGGDSSVDWATAIDVTRAGCYEFFAEFARIDDGTHIALTPAARDRGSVDRVVVAPPALTRRGPVARFVAQPELVVRLTRPVACRGGDTCGCCNGGMTPPSSPSRVTSRHALARAPGCPRLLLECDAHPLRPRAMLSEGTGGGGEGGDAEEDAHGEALQDAADAAAAALGEEGEEGEGEDEEGEGTSLDAGAGSGEEREGASPPPQLQEGRAALLPGLLLRNSTPCCGGVGLTCSRPGCSSAAIMASSSRGSSTSPNALTHVVAPGTFVALESEEVILPLPLDGISVQTQLTRCLGPIDGWLRYVDCHSAAAEAAACMGRSVSGIGMAAAAAAASTAAAAAPPLSNSAVIVTGTLAEPLACKYNMLHFTPPQRLGGSSSCYSLADQLCLDWDTFAGNAIVAQAAARALGGLAPSAQRLLAPPPPITNPHAGSGDAVGAAARAAAEYRLWRHPRVEGAKSAVFGALTEELESRFGVLSMADVVLNHTSTDTPWLLRHPEAGYSLANSPHLRPAFELDEAMLRTSDAIARGAIAGAGPVMCDERAVGVACDTLANSTTYGAPASRLWEFYVLDARATLAAAVALSGMLNSADYAAAMAALTQEDNVEGGDATRSAPLPPPFTPHVPPPQLSHPRRFALAACAHPDVRALLAQLDTAVVPDFVASVSAEAIERVAACLCAPPPPLRVEEAVRRLKQRGGGGELATPLVSPLASPPNTEANLLPPALNAMVHSQPSASSAPSGALASPLVGAAVETRASLPPLNTSASAISDNNDSSPFGCGGAFNDGSGSRFPVHLDVFVACEALSKLLPQGVRITPSAWMTAAVDPAVSSTGALSLLPSLVLLKRLCEAVNKGLYARYDADLSSALGSIRGSARYSWLTQASGLESLTPLKPLTWSYFARIIPGGGGNTIVLACNGFIWNGDPEIDFTLPTDVAHAYAELVRAGTEEPEFVKRPRVAAALQSGSAGGSGPQLLPSASSSSPGEAAVAAAVASMELAPTSIPAHESPFLGAELLELPRAHLERLCAAHDTGDDDTVAAVENAFAAAAAAASVHEEGVHPPFPPATMGVDTNLHLRPDVLVPALVSASTPYMRRDVVIWGDCAKLRYGLGRLDSPWLWAHMRVYVRRMARLFHALRIDNAHGTPLHVAAAMIDAAREVRPALYVNAELFTGSLGRDVEYVSRLGVASLVREAMQADSPGALTCAIVSSGGAPIASLRPPLRGGSTAARIEALVAAGAAGTGTRLRDATAATGTAMSTGMLLGTPYHSMSRIAGSFDTPQTPPSGGARSHVATTHRNTIDFSRSVNGFNLAALGAGARSSSQHTLSLALAASAEAAVSEVLPSPLAALLFDCSHDNECPAQKRTPEDALSTLALVSSSVCASGSVRGFDTLTPENISVVTDMRSYTEEPHAHALMLRSWCIDPIASATVRQPPSVAPCVQGSDAEPAARIAVDMSSGLRVVRRRLNALKQEMAARGHSEIFAASHEGEVVSVVRAHPSLPTSYIFIARTAFKSSSICAMPTLRVEGRVTGIVLAASLHVPTQRVCVRPPKGRSTPIQTLVACDALHPVRRLAAGASSGSVATALHILRSRPSVSSEEGWSFHSSSCTPESGTWEADPHRINGLSSSLRYSDETDVLSDDFTAASLSFATFSMVSEGSDKNSCLVTYITLNSSHFVPGSILVLRAKQPRNVALRSFLPSTVPVDVTLTHPTCSPASTRLLAAGFASACAPTSGDLRACFVADSLTLVHLNALLYRCASEERDSGGSLYVVPGSGPLPWAGLAGVELALRHCRRWNDMSHPLLSNLRSGCWLLDYTVARLEREPLLSPVASWLSAHFRILGAMPPGLRPQGFDRVVSCAFHTAVEACLARMPSPLLQSFCESSSSASPHCASHFFSTPAPASSSASRGASPWMESAYALGEEGEQAEDDVNSDAVFDPSWRDHLNEADPSAPLPLLTSLALMSVQLFGASPHAPLLALPLLVADPGSGGLVSDEGGESPLFSFCPSLAAGVDHFSSGFMRSWGRDTFISLRGLLLVTGRFAEARAVLLTGATLVRHGLLPNLLDSGRSPRYNARDAVWWFLQALQDYTRLAPEGERILCALVRRRFPSDDELCYEPSASGPVFLAGRSCGFSADAGSTLPPSVLSACMGDIVHDILSRHAHGIAFTEWGAGPRIDAHMRASGFVITASLDAATGLVHGGNANNCGTWCDKMGSVEGVNAGEPATPRDGAAVEITGLVYSTASWLAALHARSPAVFPYAGVALPPSSGGGTLTYAEWGARLRANFERLFFVPTAAHEDSAFALSSAWINRRGIYKDTHGSSAGWADYQLRPNALVAMAVAPDLFTPARADAALLLVEQQLLGENQLGVKTLDPGDWAFRGCYDNAAGRGSGGDGGSPACEKAIAGGWNYHQGPEWLWPYGYYLRARMLFPPRAAMVAEMGGAVDVTALGLSARPRWESYASLRMWVYARLARQRAHLEASPVGGLPELTNEGGAHCADSCTSQAWSGATLLDALYDLEIGGRR